LRLRVIVAEHERGNVVGHLRQQDVARLYRQLAGANQIVQEDLDIHFAIGRVDASGVVDKVRIDAATALRILDSTELRYAEVAPLRDHAAAKLLAVHADQIVAGIASVGVRLATCLDVGTDTAAPQEVHSRAQDCADQVRRRDGRFR